MNRISKEEYYLNIAKTVAERSTCLRRRYGCIIVKNDEIIATGYNGSARGERNCCDDILGVSPKCPRVNEPHNSGDYSNCPAVHAEQNAMLSAARKDMIGATMYLDGEEWVNEYIKDGVIPGTAIGRMFWREIKDCTPCPMCIRMIANSGIEKVITRKGVIWEKGN